jgi:hypothetical protein
VTWLCGEMSAMIDLFLFLTTPAEGCPISSMTPEQREQVYAIVRAFNIYLPDGPLEHRMKLIRQYEDQTYFAWIGKNGLADPYYYSIHSPVTFSEVSYDDARMKGVLFGVLIDEPLYSAPV